MMATRTAEPPNILSPAHLGDPFETYRQLLDDYPIFWHELSKSWVVSRWDDVHFLLREKERVGTEHMQELLSPVLGETTVLLALDGKEHTQQRRRASPFVHAAGLRRFTSTIVDRLDALLGSLLDRERQAVARGERESGRIDLVREFTSIYPVDVVAAMMGVSFADYAQMQRWYNAFLDYGSNLGGDPEIFARGLRAKQEFGEFILPLIAERRRDSSGDDLITRLCHHESDGRTMTDQEIRTFLALMLLAGGETTDHQLAAFVHVLAQHPDQLRQLQEDRSLMDAALAEGMRYCSIVQFFTRSVREDFEFQGFQFRAGDGLTLMLAPANHDPRRFSNPDEFNIHRDDSNSIMAFTGAAEHVGFGGGRHVCLGTHLAKREMELAVNLLLDQAADIRLADGYEPRYGPSPFMKSLLNLDLTFRPV